MTRIEKLAAEYGSTAPVVSERDVAMVAFRDGYRRALSDMQNASPAIASRPDVSLRQILAAVAKEMENG